MKRIIICCLLLLCCLAFSQDDSFWYEEPKYGPIVDDSPWWKPLVVLLAIAGAIWFLTKIIRVLGEESRKKTEKATQTASAFRRLSYYTEVKIEEYMKKGMEKKDAEELAEKISKKMYGRFLLSGPTFGKMSDEEFERTFELLWHEAEKLIRVKE